MSHGPAYTWQLEWNGGEEYKGLRISVDLALAPLKINSRPNKIDLEFESESGKVLKSVFDSVRRIVWAKWNNYSRKLHAKQWKELVTLLPDYNLWCQEHHPAALEARKDPFTSTQLTSQTNY